MDEVSREKGPKAASREAEVREGRREWERERERERERHLLRVGRGARSGALIVRVCRRPSIAHRVADYVPV